MLDAKPTHQIIAEAEHTAMQKGRTPLHFELKTWTDKPLFPTLIGWANKNFMLTAATIEERVFP